MCHEEIIFFQFLFPHEKFIGEILKVRADFRTRVWQGNNAYEEIVEVEPKCLLDLHHHVWKSQIKLHDHFWIESRTKFSNGAFELEISFEIVILNFF